jgi:hypothetical protein
MDWGVRRGQTHDDVSVRIGLTLDTSAHLLLERSPAFRVPASISINMMGLISSSEMGATR